jgi:hypothetical protein
VQRPRRRVEVEVEVGGVEWRGIGRGRPASAPGPVPGQPSVRMASTAAAVAAQPSPHGTGDRPTRCPPPTAIATLYHGTEALLPHPPTYLHPLPGTVVELLLHAVPLCLQVAQILSQLLLYPTRRGGQGKKVQLLSFLGRECAVVIFLPPKVSAQASQQISVLVSSRGLLVKFPFQLPQAPLQHRLGMQRFLVLALGSLVAVVHLGQFLAKLILHAL